VLLAFIYVGFQAIPWTDLGVDLSKEYAVALRMFNERKKG